MLMNELEKYIIVEGERVFVDICKKGCGSKCAYCYVPQNGDKQVLLSKEQILTICKYIDEKFRRPGMIISLCPNTEPLKSKECIELILLIAKYFSSCSCYIQISTKEVVPRYFLEEMNDLERAKVYINISIPDIVNSGKLEPYAALVEERLHNFEVIKEYENINVCLYIKPFIAKREAWKRYVSLINKYKITRVCVGPQFIDNIGVPCTSLYIEEKARRIYNNQRENIKHFSQMLRKYTDAQIYSSSVCCIYNDFCDNCTLRLFRYEVNLCADCRLKDVIL